MSAGDRGMVNGWPDGGRTIRIPLWLAVLGPVLCLLVAYVAGALVAIDRGWDNGYRAAMGEVKSSLREQIGEGRKFSLKGLDGVRFHPRADGETNYTMAGSGADSRAK